MSTVRRSEGLLSAKQTVELLALINQDQKGSSKVQLIRDLAASYPASWARADNTITLLCGFGVLIEGNGLVQISDPQKYNYDSWFEYLGKLIADYLAGQLSQQNLSGCIQADGNKGGGLWIDSMLIPNASEGLSLLIVEFRIATRKSIKERFWRLDSKYEPMFLDAIREANTQLDHSKITLKELEERLAKDAANGLLAEEWILKYEKKRLASHPLVDQVRRISDDDVSAGYDVVSFSSAGALNHDLYIEVKSYFATKRFYWSRNEIKTAERMGEKYSLYLVDRSMMEQPDYEPQIISGPYAALIDSNSSGWLISPNSFECIAKV